MSNISKDKLNYLEGLRGIAALTVVFYHYALAFYPAMIYGNSVTTHFKYENLISYTPLSLLFSGPFAVSIFFVLSGYVLSYKFFKHPDIKIILSLALRRYFRLMIPVFGSVFIAYLLLKFHLIYSPKIYPLSFSVWFSTFYHFAPSFWSMLYQGLIGPFINPAPPGYNNVLWTMYYEFLGSFLVFLFLGFFGTRKIRPLIYTLLIIIFWKTFFLAFILGMLLCDVTVDKKNNLFSNNGLKLFWLLLLPASLFIASYSNEKIFFSFLKLSFLTSGENSDFYHTIGAFLLLASIIRLDWLINFLSQKYILFLGKISFSLYLIHFLVISSFSSFLFYTLAFHISYNLTSIIVFPLTLAVTICSAYFFTKYVDANGIKFSRFFARRIMKTTSNPRIK